jgi:hypothetical protein
MVSQPNLKNENYYKCINYGGFYQLNSNFCRKIKMEILTIDITKHQQVGDINTD